MNRFRVWDKALKTYNLNDFYINADGKLFRLSVDGKLLTVHSDRFIVERCTGLTDKNGKLIFEGDVDSVGMAVRYRDGAFELYKDEFNVRLDSKNAAVIEIIGNIHEMEVEE